MKIWLRVSTLSLAAAIGLTAAPSRGADATLAHDQPAVPLTGAEQWALRPTKVVLTAAVLARAEKTVPLSDLPAERRKVRIVYQGYPEAAPLSVTR